MMGLSLSRLAKESGLAKSTISRALDSGELSAAKDAKGRFVIDPSEAARWIAARDAAPRAERGGAGRSAAAKREDGGGALGVEVRMLREMLDGEKAARERAEARAEAAEARAHDLAERVLKIEDQRADKGGWLKRLLGG